MPDTGNVIAGTGANDASYGVNAWSSASNITADDAATADCTINADLGQYLAATNFNHTIPAAASIVGIELIYNYNRSGTVHIWDRVRLIKGGTIQAHDKGGGFGGSGTNLFVTFGGPTDLWGNTWTPSDINASNFGSVLAARRAFTTGTGQLQVDAVWTRVYYLIPEFDIPQVSYSLVTYAPELQVLFSSVDLMITVADFNYELYAPLVAIDLILDVPSLNFNYGTNTPELKFAYSFSVPSRDYEYAAYSPFVPVDQVFNIAVVDFTYITYAPLIKFDFTFVIPGLEFTFADYSPGVAVDQLFHTPVRQYTYTPASPQVVTEQIFAIPVSDFAFAILSPGFAVDRPFYISQLDFQFQTHTPAFIQDHLFYVPVRGFDYAVYAPVHFTGNQFDIPHLVFDFRARAPLIIAELELPTDITELDLTPPREVSPEFQRWLINNFTILQSIHQRGVSGVFTSADGKVIVVRNGIVEEIF